MSIAMRRRIGIFAALILISWPMLAAGVGFAQDDGEALLLPADLPVLDFVSYDLNWTRYKNVDEAGQPKLAIEGVTQFPFRWIRTDVLLEPDDFDADTIQALGQRYDMAYDASRVVGICDTAKLPGAIPDTLCSPGTTSMPLGKVIAALYHPETFEIVAIASGIYNVDGAAVHYGVEPPEPPPTCGPYQKDEWIKAQVHHDSRLDLPVKGDNVGNPITDYRCVAPETGASYLQAYSIISAGEPVSGKSKRDSGSASRDNGNGSGDNGNGSGGDNGNDGDSSPSPPDDLN